MFVEHEELRLERQEFEEGHFGVVRWNATLIDQNNQNKGLMWFGTSHYIWVVTKKVNSGNILI